MRRKTPACFWNVTKVFNTWHIGGSHLNLIMYRWESRICVDSMFVTHPTWQRYDNDKRQLPRFQYFKAVEKWHGNICWCSLKTISTLWNIKLAAWGNDSGKTGTLLFTHQSPHSKPPSSHPPRILASLSSFSACTFALHVFVHQLPLVSTIYESVSRDWESCILLRRP